jgi:hypothetical protein
MKTYTIGFDASDRDNVLELIRDFSYDIIIDRVEEDNVRLTIELDDDESDKMYNYLQEAVLRNTEINWMI